MKNLLILLVLLLTSLVGQASVDTLYSQQDTLLVEKIVEKNVSTYLFRAEERVTTTVERLISQKIIKNKTGDDFSSEEIKTLFKAKEGEFVEMEHEELGIPLPIFVSVFPIPQTRDVLSGCVIKNSEVQNATQEQKPQKDYDAFVLWILLPGTLIILMGIIAPKEKKRKLFIFFGAITSVVLSAVFVGTIAGPFMGGLTGLIAGAIVGLIVGAVVRGEAGLIAGFVVGAPTGGLTGEVAGTSDIWVIIPQYFIFLLIFFLISYLVFSYKNRNKIVQNTVVAQQ